MESKQKKQYARFLLLYLLINLVFFATSYFAIKPLEQFLQIPILILVNVMASLYIGCRLKTSVVRKVLFIIVASFSSSFVGFVLVFSTMYLPGSREHNYVMYNICLPAMKKHYGISENEGFPDSGQYDKDGQQKWWYQHSECEQNVWNGKGPVFSEDPPGFIPVAK